MRKLNLIELRFIIGHQQSKSLPLLRDALDVTDIVDQALRDSRTRLNQRERASLLSAVEFRYDQAMRLQVTGSLDEDMSE